MKRVLSSQSGFTLLEVLVALAIVAIALTGLIKGVGGNTANISYLRDRTFSQWVGMNAIAELKLSSSSTGDRKTRGKESLGGHFWYWRCDFSDTFDDDIQKVVVEVRADERSDAEPVTRLTAFLPKPKQKVSP